MEKSDIPVLLIPEKYELSPIKNILFTTNFEAADKAAFHLVFKIAGVYNALVTIVHINDPYAKYSVTTDENIERLNYFLQQEFNESRIQFREFKTTSFMETLEHLHDEIPYDLVIMARRKLEFADRIFEKSFTKKMAFITRYPLLIIPEPE